VKRRLLARGGLWLWVWAVLVFSSGQSSPSSSSVSTSPISRPGRFETGRSRGTKWPGTTTKCASLRVVDQGGPAPRRCWRCCSAPSRPLGCTAQNFFGRDTISLLLVLPIALPGIITGVALHSTFQWAGIDLSIWTIIIGHTTFCIVVVYNNVIARLRRTSSTLFEASADLGASAHQTFRFVTLPLIATALVSGGLLAFALSFDEVIVTTFTAGAQNTLPIGSSAPFASVNSSPRSTSW